MRISLAALLLTGCSMLFAQSNLPLPGCETRPEVRRVIDEKLTERTLKNIKFTERVALKRQVLEDLIAQYPREREPYIELLNMRDDDPAAFPALRDRFVKLAADHPDDPLALYLAAVALTRIDTPRSIQLLDRAHAEAPDFAWPELSLAGIHSNGKLADKPKAAAEIVAFFAACPSSTDNRAQASLSRAGALDLQARVAVALRARLAQETDPKRLQNYATLWGLEFRTRPPQEHDALRKQVAADLKRLESLNPSPDVEWLVFLKDGYKQSGALPETVTAMEDRVIKAFPHSPEAFDIVNSRWDKENKEPEDQKDAAAWARYNAAYEAAMKTWMTQFTESRMVQHQYWFYAVSDDEDVSEKEGLAALDSFVTEIEDYQQPRAWSYLSAASFLVDHKWQLARAIELARLSEKWAAAYRDVESNDNLNADEAKMRAEQDLYQRQFAEGIVLRAARIMGQPEQADFIKASVEAAPPDDQKMVWRYWLNRARLAALEGHKADALTFYQQALFTRPNTPEPFHGKLKDEVIDEAEVVWHDTGGTETAWNIWKTLPSGKAQELADGRWEKPTRTMPAFELADLAGKTWRLKNLEGKSVLINVWATWCGPCQMELPKLQKLYEKVKDRPDLQIVTFNIDEDLGLVSPFVKEKGYTFPVLPAYSFVLSLLDGVAIPQNWILDPKGVWRLTQFGYDASDAQWAETMVGKLQSVR